MDLGETVSKPGRVAWDAEGRMNRNKEMQQKMMNYIDALEHANQHLVIALKRGIELLVHLQPTDVDQKEWKSMLDDLEGIIRVGERITGQNPIH